jgi:hypothetical protein
MLKSELPHEAPNPVSKKEARSDRGITFDATRNSSFGGDEADKHFA